MSFLRSPWFFVPALYLAVGCGGGGIVGTLSSVMFKDLGFSNVLVGAVALLSLPSSLRFLWSPWIDALGPKRDLTGRFIFVMALLVAALSGLVWMDWVHPLPAFAILFVFALTFSCLEVAADGYYIRVFDQRRQAEFVGIKAASIRGGIILCIVLFVTLAGSLQESGWTKPASWGTAVAGAAVFLFLMALYNTLALPVVSGDTAVRDTTGFPIRTILVEYLRQDRAWAILAMLLVFRFGQGIFIYMAPPFYMDDAASGGYGMNATDVGLLKAYTDIPPMIIGGILGGFIIMKLGLKRTIIPFTLLMSVPNFAYVYLAVALPQHSFELLGRSFFTGVFVISFIESLGYGIGFSGFFYYIHAIARGPHKTSMLAISSGLMGLGFYLPGALSGVIQTLTGYPVLFSLSAIIGLLTLVIVPFLPMPDFETKEEAGPRPAG